MEIPLNPIIKNSDEKLQKEFLHVFSLRKYMIQGTLSKRVIHLLNQIVDRGLAYYAKGEVFSTEYKESESFSDFVCFIPENLINILLAKLDVLFEQDKSELFEVFSKFLENHYSELLK